MIPEDIKNTGKNETGSKCLLPVQPYATCLRRYYCAIFGKTEEELIGYDLFRMMNPENAAALKASFASLTDEPHVAYYEEQSKTVKGFRWFAWSVTAVINEKGEIDEIVSVGRDITDQNGSIQYVNPAFEKITGYKKEEVQTQNPRILKSGRQDEMFYRDLWTTIKNGKIWQGEMVNKKKDGSFYTEESTISPVFDKTGNIKNFVSVKRDITGEIQMKEKLQEAQRMESIGNLAGGIAHDFNNILFPIVGMSELLMEDLPKNSIKYKNAQEILKAGKRGRDLVKQILAFSHQHKPETMPVRLQQVLKEVLKLTRSAIPSNIRISQNLQKDCGPTSADPTQIHQVAMNLLTNAFHAVEETNGEISISLKEIALEEVDLQGIALPTGRYALLTVSDNGSGIDEKIINKIFDPYFTTKGKDKGTGLGLAVVYGIIAKLGGDITVESETGIGTTFKAYFPVISDDPEPAPFATSEITPTGKEHILLVDDEEPIAKMEKQMLERLGYKVTLRLSSLDALEAFKVDAGAYDLVISDLAMPNMTGDILARRLIEIRPDIPVIICTGFSERINREKAAAIGIKGFLMKPVVKLDIAMMVRKVLDESKNKDSAAY